MPNGVERLLWFIVRYVCTTPSCLLCSTSYTGFWKKIVSAWKLNVKARLFLFALHICTAYLCYFLDGHRSVVDKDKQSVRD